MKTIFKVLLLLVVCITGYTADNLIKPSYPGGMMYLKDATNSTVPAIMLYSTDGNGNLKTMNGITPVSDDIVKPSAPGGMLYLKDNTGKTLPAMVAFTTDGNGNIEPISGGGGGGGSLTPGSVQNLTAGFTITSSSPYIPVTATGGSVSSDGVTAISNGTSEGQLLLIENRDATNYIEILHNANTVMPGSARQRIYPKGTMMFVWNGTDWVCKSDVSNGANVVTRIPVMTQIDRDTTYGGVFPPNILVLNTTTRTLSLGGGATWTEMNPNNTSFQFSNSLTTPSGVSSTALRNSSGSPGAIFNSLQNVDLLLETANALGAESGDINLQTGTSDTVRGRVQILSPLYISGSERVAARIDTTGVITVSAESDSVVLSNPGLPGPTSVALPPCVDGLKFTIKDASGTAGVNSITITRAGLDTFEGGGSTIVINTNFGSRTIVCHSTVWYIIARSP